MYTKFSKEEKLEVKGSIVVLIVWGWYSLLNIITAPYRYITRQHKRASDRWTVFYKRHKNALKIAKEAYHRNSVDMPQLVAEELKKGGKGVDFDREYMKTWWSKTQARIEHEKKIMAEQGLDFDKVRDRGIHYKEMENNDNQAQ